MEHPILKLKYLDEGITKLVLELREKSKTEKGKGR
jgi:hypothetical protein